MIALPRIMLNGGQMVEVVQRSGAPSPEPQPPTTNIFPLISFQRLVPPSPLNPELEGHMPFSLEECPSILANFLGQYPSPGMQMLMWSNMQSVSPLLVGEHGEDLLDAISKGMEIANWMERAETENRKWIELPERMVGRIRRETVCFMNIIGDYARELTGYDHGKQLYTPHFTLHIDQDGMHHHSIMQAEIQVFWNRKYRDFSLLSRNPFLTELEFFWLKCMAEIIAAAHAKDMGIEGDYAGHEDALADLMDGIAGWSIVPRPLTPPVSESSSGEESSSQNDPSGEHDWTPSWENVPLCQCILTLTT